jgi:hypothetical protein
VSSARRCGRQVNTELKQNVTFSGYDECVAHEFSSGADLVAIEDALGGVDALCHTSHICYGKTGPQVLERLSKMYPLFGVSEGDPYWGDVGVNVLILAVCKLSYFALLLLSSYKASTLNPSQLNPSQSRASAVHPEAGRT